MTDALYTALSAASDAMKVCGAELGAEPVDASLLARSAIAEYLRATGREDEAMRVIHTPV